MNFGTFRILEELLVANIQSHILPFDFDGHGYDRNSWISTIHFFFFHIAIMAVSIQMKRFEKVNVQPSSRS